MINYDHCCPVNLVHSWRQPLLSIWRVPLFVTEGMNSESPPETRREPIHGGSSPVRPPRMVEVQVLQEQKPALRVEVSDELSEFILKTVNWTAVNYDHEMTQQ